MEIGKAIDELYALRAKRLEMAREVDLLKLAETLKKQEIMDHLKGIGLSRASGSVATAGRTSKIVPLVQDWDKLFDYIAANKAWDLVQKRIGALAWTARHEDGILVPGTEPSEVFDLSLTKASRS